MQRTPFTEADVGAIVAIETAAADFPWSAQQFQSSLSSGNHCQAVKDDEQLVGFSIFSLVMDEASLLNIAVHPGYQGRGLGRMLLEQGLQDMAGQGAGSCFLEVRVSNLSAQSLYYSMGFQVVGERKAYYPAHNGRENALVMSRQLPVAAVTTI